MNPIFELIEKALPSGSGFDCDYNFKTQINGKIKCHSYYHCMNDHGYYDGYVGFNIIIDIYACDFKLTFDSDSHNKARTYFLREYMEDTISSYLSEAGML